MKLRFIFKQIFSCLQTKKKKVVPFFDRSENDTVNIGGVDWAVLNTGTDEENPQGKLYTIEEAMLLENERWRLPTVAEVHELKEKSKSENDKGEIKGIWISHENDKEERLFIPINRSSFHQKSSSEMIMGALWIKESMEEFYILESCIRNRVNTHPYLEHQPITMYMKRAHTMLGFKAGVRLIRRNLNNTHTL